MSLSEPSSRLGPRHPVGFIGLGSMGSPMAQNLLRSGQPLVVWNRTPERIIPIAEAGAEVCASAAGVFQACSTVIVMVSDIQAIDEVLARGTPDFERRVSGRLIIGTATIGTKESSRLAEDIRHCGGRYVEAPVSGSKRPAELGQLIAMLAGDRDDVEDALPLFAPLCRSTVYCGDVPAALTMKFAVNIFLIASVSGLAESAHFAKSRGIDLAAWATVVNASQMASEISRLKVSKLVADDWSPQAAIVNVCETNRLITSEARQFGIDAPLMEATLRLYQRAIAMGLDVLDMISVVEAFTSRFPETDRDSSHT